MNADSLVILACAVCLAACSVYFIVHRDYEDGIVGNLALWAVCGASVLIAYGIVARRAHVAIDELTETLLVAITVFVVRHALRFWRWHTFGVHSWREAKDAFCARRDCARRETRQ